MSLFRLGRARVGNVVITVNVVFIVCMIVSSFILMNALNHLKVRGPIYTQIRDAVDLTADILPPPLYLIETYLTIEQFILTDSDEGRKELEAKVVQLEKDFATREEYWKHRDLPQNARNILDNEVLPAGEKMLSVINDKFLPSIKQQKKEDVDAALSEIEAQYKIHRTAVDRLVVAATEVLNGAEDSSKKEEQSYLMLAYIALGITVLTSVLGALGLMIIVVKPLKTVTSSLGQLAEGNTNVTVGDSIGNGEMPQLWRAVVGLREKVLAEKKLLAEQENIKKTSEEEKKKAMERLADAFHGEVVSIIGDVNTAVAELQSMAKAMSEAAKETSKQSGTVAAASEQATANVQTVASATEELSASVNEIQMRVAQSNVMIQQADQQVVLTNQRVQGLTEAASKIGAVIQFITDIAAQTNLLALNATIEAARAGDAGKGFAVVASEVKNLAGQTAQATDEIALQIKNIQDETKASADAIRNITKAIADVNQTSSAIAAAVEEQGAATQEIARNVSEAAQGTSGVSASIVNVSNAAQKTGVAASHVLTAAGELSKNGESLKRQVEAFLQKIKTA